MLLKIDHLSSQQAMTEQKNASIALLYQHHPPRWELPSLSVCLLLTLKLQIQYVNGISNTNSNNTQKWQNKLLALNVTRKLMRKM